VTKVRKWGNFKPTDPHGNFSKQSATAILHCLKTSCVLCGGHIEFPAHAVGLKIPCPHCKMDITLKEPA
jgi:hypothetical protein